MQTFFKKIVNYIYIMYFYKYSTYIVYYIYMYLQVLQRHVIKHIDLYTHIIHMYIYIYIDRHVRYILRFRTFSSFLTSAPTTLRPKFILYIYKMCVSNICIYIEKHLALVCAGGSSMLWQSSGSLPAIWTGERKRDIYIYNCFQCECIFNDSFCLFPCASCTLPVGMAICRQVLL